MTQNQLAYQAMLETKRHNIRTEGQTDRQIDESVRHNIAGEQHNVNVLRETVTHNRNTEQEANRHNVETEREANRHNVRQEVTDLRRHDENVRHSKQMEAYMAAQNLETARSNREKERQAQQQYELANKKYWTGVAYDALDIFGLSPKSAASIGKDVLSGIGQFVG